MSKHQKSAIWALRLGLAAVYLYSGPDLILHPGDWIGYLPGWLKEILPAPPELYLRAQGIVEILFALSFLTGFGIKWSALFSAAEMLGIILFYGIDGVSFRDLGLFGAAICLFLFYFDEKEVR